VREAFANSLLPAQRAQQQQQNTAAAVANRIVCSCG
jgi:hypothetical protein